MNAYKTIDTIRTERVWIKINRNADKSFSFHVGYTNDVQSFKTANYPKEFMSTIKEAKEHANMMAADYI